MRIHFDQATFHRGACKAHLGCSVVKRAPAEPPIFVGNESDLGRWVSCMLFHSPATIGI